MAFEVYLIMVWFFWKLAAEKKNFAEKWEQSMYNEFNKCSRRILCYLPAPLPLCHSLQLRIKTQTDQSESSALARKIKRNQNKK